MNKVKFFGAILGQFYMKNPFESISEGFFSDSYRISAIQSFAIMIKCITFVYQRITVVNSLWIATEFC